MDAKIAALPQFLREKAAATRPVLADECMQIDKAGPVVLKLPAAWRDGTIRIVMSPLEFMQRRAAWANEGRLSGTRVKPSLPQSSRCTTLSGQARPDGHKSMPFDFPIHLVFVVFLFNA